KAVRRVVARDVAVGRENLLQQHDVVILAEDAVERLEPPLVPQQLVAAAAFEQADVEPVILDIPAPGVEVRRLRLRPGDDHGLTGAVVALLEPWCDRGKSLGAEFPCFDVAAFRSKRARGDRQYAACAGFAIGPRATVDETGAD